ncbi:type 1 glutamine amidotransferase domain-containing protein [Ferrimonas marina]|uniref:Putative intracellular protease/amidase n=1 Tax=Ferrimonas marina TaxID=299255 RepID=A0A1M5RZD0_9GAMM|nr:type 1 glutamine amidotransferase domain-containing protein [Ferrimonas marina]SHH31727.1 Putative intracellular protease/amidase [Ferrimonas marina]
MSRITSVLAAASLTLGAAALPANAADKVLLVSTSHDTMGDTAKPTGLFLSELVHPYFVLTEAGYQVDVVSIAGGDIPVDPSSFREADAGVDRFLADDQLSALLKNTNALASVDSADYQAVVYAGGHGTMWDFRQSEAVQQVSTEVYQAGGVVAAVCHGPAALVDVQLADGRYLIDGVKVTGFSNKEEEMVQLTDVVPYLLEDAMQQRGGQFSAAAPWNEHVVVDQRVVTGQNPQSAHALGEAVVQQLKALQPKS